LLQIKQPINSIQVKSKSEKHHVAFSTFKKKENLTSVRD